MAALSPDDVFRLKHSLAEADGNHYYGDGGTIHGTGYLDIEIDPATGEVTAVWFRCLNLPFRTFSRDEPAVVNPDIGIRGVEYRERGEGK
jgi:hypothetical protein